jgi:winged helix DNA-binding protein
VAPSSKSDLARRRLITQRLVGSSFKNPVDAVSWFGAVQSQDYAGAKWALGQRTGLHDASLDRAFDAGEILRTHVLRPTWHFVAPADIRWMLELTGPRVHCAMAYYGRQYGLDPKTLSRARVAIQRALKGGTHLTRAEIAAVLKKAGIDAQGIRLGLLLMHEELDGIVCSGMRRGKQFTYALLDERVPPAEALSRDEALAALTVRYFTSHGPATVRDFVWWSGLTVKDAKAGLAMAGKALVEESADGLTYWSSPTERSRVRVTSPLVHLLPNYDECLIAYKDRGNIGHVATPSDPRLKRLGVFYHQLLVDGRLAGSWRRSVGRKSVAIEVLPHRTLTKAERKALDAAAARHGEFIGLSANVSVL